MKQSNQRSGTKYFAWGLAFALSLLLAWVVYDVLMPEATEKSISQETTQPVEIEKDTATIDEGPETDGPGLSSGTESQPPAVAKLKLTLVGVVAGKDEKSGIALISFESNAAQSYQVGQLVGQTDARLYRVNKEFVLLKRPSGIERLELSGSTSSPDNTPKTEKEFMIQDILRRQREPVF